ncbi:MAG: helix-turn-helix domain-containing protein, partial [Planctomyces sp.]
MRRCGCAPGGAPCSLAHLALHRLREQCGFTLEQAARLLEIREARLSAIEDNANGRHADPAL